MEAPPPRPKRSISPMKDGRKLQFSTAALGKFAKGLSSLGVDDEDAKTMPNYNLQALFSPELDDGAVVLTIPSLELNVEARKQQDVLPTLGEHAAETDNSPCSPALSNANSANNTSSVDATAGKNQKHQMSIPSKPDMAASVFAKAKGNAKDIEDQKPVEFTSRKISWTKSTVPYASSAVCANLSRSFKTLLNSRLRAWTLLLLRHSLSTGSSESRSQLLGMLSAKIEIVETEVTFKTLTLPEEAVGIKPKDSDAVLPLLFEASIKISIQGKQERVVLKAPGTISTIFGDHGLKSVNVKLDSKMMMKAMVDQSRLVVLQAVSAATSTAPDLVKVQVAKSTIKDSNDFPLPQKRLPSKNALSTLAAAKSIPTVNQSPQAQKARSSALRLDSLLQGKTHQSVPFFSSRLLAAQMEDKSKRKAGPTLGALAPEPKVARFAMSAAKLKSFKSFGRPHGGGSGSGPNNATFGEFGSGHSGMWGRDGRMVVHPQPMRGGLTADKNALFGDSTSQSAAEMGAAMLGGLTRSRSSMSNHGLVTRTPTALESSLMKKLAR